MKINKPGFLACFLVSIISLYVDDYALEAFQSPEPLNILNDVNSNNLSWIRPQDKVFGRQDACPEEISGSYLREDILLQNEIKKIKLLCWVPWYSHWLQ